MITAIATILKHINKHCTIPGYLENYVKKDIQNALTEIDKNTLNAIDEEIERLEKLDDLSATIDTIYGLRRATEIIRRAK